MNWAILAGRRPVARRKMDPPAVGSERKREDSGLPRGEHASARHVCAGERRGRSRAALVLPQRLGFSHGIDGRARQGGRPDASVPHISANANGRRCWASPHDESRPDQPRRCRRQDRGNPANVGRHSAASTRRSANLHSRPADGGGSRFLPPASSRSSPRSRSSDLRIFGRRSSEALRQDVITDRAAPRPVEEAGLEASPDAGRASLRLRKACQSKPDAMPRRPEWHSYSRTSP
jgi:hypothetical protein